MSASAFVGNMHRLAAFVLLSMVVLRLTAGATTCDADPKKGLFGYEGACFDLIDRLDSKHGEVCISTIVRAPTSSRPGGTCLRAKFTVPSTDESILKLRAGVHKKGDPITSKSSRYTRKRTVASLNSPHVHKASLVFCPSAISVLEIPCCGSDLQFLGFAVVSSPGAIINGPNQVDEQLQLKAYISPQTTTEGICDETRIGGGRKEFLCTLKLTCDSCPNSACNDSGTCVRTSDYACGDLGEEFKDPDTGACGCRCDPSKTDVCVDETNGCVKVSDFESQSCSSSEVAVIDPSDNSCQCEAVACGENECFDPIQGCLSLESSAFCDAGGPGSLLYKDDHGSCSCCPQGSCFSVDSDAGGIKCISEADFGSDCTFSSAITDSEGLCQCCASLPDHCFDTDQQKCVGPAERKTACDAEAAADPFGRQLKIFTDFPVRSSLDFLPRILRPVPHGGLETNSDSHNTLGALPLFQFAPAKAAPGACECCPGVGDNENSCVNADQQCVSRQAFSSSNCNGLFPHADASGNCECCRTAVGEDQCVIFGQCIDNDKYAAGFCGSELGASLGAPDENGFCHCVSRCPADQCLDDSNTCVSVSSDSAKAVCESLPKIPQHVLAVKNENTEKCECCGADSSDCVNLDGGIDNATCVSTSAYSSTTCSSSEVRILSKRFLFAFFHAPLSVTSFRCSVNLLFVMRAGSIH
ncbi:hypothetical protein NDN08_005008 [Rhodosorus marinus]|uniref:Uncharacterized protein n=1 Tax=Rhodosorus marinus TaxID=101924 RepID=A0AAV8UJC1_9RHOD|nr:hypothetical protein NDN08_005008 [Rhodosorus marinus]